MSTLGGVAGLTADEVHAYRSTGYVLLPDRVPGSFLADVQAVIEQIVDDVVAGWTGTTESTEPRLGDGDHLERYGRRFHAAWLAAGRPHGAATDPDDRFFGLVAPLVPSQTWLTGLAAQLLGTSGAAVLPSSFFRARFPDDAASTLPWHQDVQCLQPISGPDFVTAWIPLVDVGEQSSCLEVSPVGPGTGMLEPGWSELTDYVCMRDEDRDRLTEVHPLCMRRGDLLLMSPYLPHRPLENTAGQIRWSVDLRFEGSG